MLDLRLPALAAWVEERETVLLLIHAGALQAVAPCRVVYVVDGPGQFSFAYGTLPGHPERGERDHHERQLQRHHRRRVLGLAGLPGHLDQQ